MKAKDIRSLYEKLQEKILNSTSVAEHESGFNSLALSLLSEVAAQLAEANEHLAKIANPLMRSPRWVTLKCNLGKGTGSLVIDANDVIGVGCQNEEPTCVICAAGKRFVDGTVEEVCTKLGIPMEGK